MFLISADWSKTIRSNYLVYAEWLRMSLWNVYGLCWLIQNDPVTLPTLCWLVKHVPTKCFWSLLIAPKQSCLIFVADLSRMSLWNVSSLCLLVQQDTVELPQSANWLSMSLVSAEWFKTILFNIPNLCWLVKNLTMECPCAVLIGPKQSCHSTSSMLIGQECP